MPPVGGRSAKTAPRCLATLPQRARRLPTACQMTAFPCSSRSLCSRKQKQRQHPQSAGLAPGAQRRPRSLRLRGSTTPQGRCLTRARDAHRAASLALRRPPGGRPRRRGCCVVPCEARSWPERGRRVQISVTQRNAAQMCVAHVACAAGARTLSKKPLGNSRSLDRNPL